MAQRDGQGDGVKAQDSEKPDFEAMYYAALKEKEAALKREEAERKEKEAALEREEAERKEKEAALEREEAERKEKEEERKEKEAERKEKEAALQREHDLKYVNAKWQLQQPLPEYSEETIMSESATSQKIWYIRPSALARWDLDPAINILLDSLEHIEVPRHEDMLNPKKAEANYESVTHRFVPNFLEHTSTLLFDAFPGQGLDVAPGIKANTNDGGFPDILYRNVSRNCASFCVEMKRPQVGFGNPSHPADLDVQASRGNLISTILQSHTYMVTKFGGMTYAMYTNLDAYGFLRRAPNNILEATRLYDRSDARSAIAAFLVEAGTNFQQHFPNLAPEIVLPPPLVAGEGEGGVFTVGAQVGGQSVTTTQSALGVANLSLTARQNSIVIATSEKGCTFRYRDNNGRDLVWRQLDVYGLPRHSRDYSFENLQSTITRELTAYTHLTNVWGDLVPRLVYFGHDLAMLWVMVTSYEGTSLSKLAKEGGGLPGSVKTKALNALNRLHGLGILHGDVALRNILFRESDQKVLLIDFEQSEVFSTDNTESIRRAEAELQDLERELARFETTPEAIVSNAQIPLKRTKVCCCSITMVSDNV